MAISICWMDGWTNEGVSALPGGIKEIMSCKACSLSLPHTVGVLKLPWKLHNTIFVIPFILCERWKYPFKDLFCCNQWVSLSLNWFKERVSQLLGNQGRHTGLSSPFLLTWSPFVPSLFQACWPPGSGFLGAPCFVHHYRLSVLHFSENAHLFSFDWPLLT